MRYLSAIIFSLGIFFLINSGCKKDIDVFIPDPVNEVDTTISPIAGCIDSTALNFNVEATTDDGSCVYDTLEVISGCMDSLALNYNELATIDSGSCIYDYDTLEVVSGCMDSTALNYNELATIDNGSCVYDTLEIVFGCMDSTALNYNELANMDDGSCEYEEVILGCTDQSALNYNPDATQDDGSCEYEEIILGCTDPSAINYNPDATQDDGSCEYFGCTDPFAANYNPLATQDDGLCEYFGCTDPLAINYDPIATIEDGSCQYSLGCTDPSAVNYDPFAVLDDGSCLYITGDIQNFFNAVQQPGETLYINNDVDDFCVNSNNTIFHAPQGLFSHPNGNIVQGQVEIEMRELHSKGDLIRYAKPTMSDGNLIYSDGVLDVSASQNGQPVEFTSGYITNIQMPSPNQNWDMNLFYGDDTAETFNWEWQPQGSPADVAGVWPNQWTVEDSMNGVFSGSGYEFWIDRLDWINCDAFANIPEDEKTTVCVELSPEIYTNQNAVVFMVIDDMNAIVQLWGDSNQMNFCVSGMPIGENVTFIAIATLNDNEYDFAMSNAVLVDNHLEALSPQTTSLGDIQNALDGL